MIPLTVSGIQIPLQWAISGLEQQKCEGEHWAALGMNQEGFMG